MRAIIRPLFTAFLIAATAFSSAAAGQDRTTQNPAAKPSPPPDPNEKVCEDITETGSRLGAKRFCATRSQWEDKKRQDRESTEKAQIMSCMPNVPGCK